MLIRNLWLVNQFWFSYLSNPGVLILYVYQLGRNRNYQFFQEYELGYHKMIRILTHLLDCWLCMFWIDYVYICVVLCTIVYICMRICIYVPLCVCRRINVNVYLYVFICMYVCVFVCTSVCVYTGVSLWISVS